MPRWCRTRRRITCCTERLSCARRSAPSCSSTSRHRGSSLRILRQSPTCHATRAWLAWAPIRGRCSSAASAGTRRLGKAPRSTLWSIPATCISSIPKQASASTVLTRKGREDGHPSRKRFSARLCGQVREPRPDARRRRDSAGGEAAGRGSPRSTGRVVMLAVRLHPEGLRIDEIEPPSPGAGEVLVRVHAAAITRGELEWPSDRLPAIVSYELSGVVADTGEEVFALTPFDRDGVAAEYAAVPASMLAPKPASLSHVEAAALPMGGLSAWQGLFEHGRLRRGERVIVTGARGGVGHLAVQLARHAGADVVEDGPAGLVFVVGPNREQLSELARLADGGELRPAVDSTFPLERARAAFERVAGRGKRGKVVFDAAGG